MNNNLKTTIFIVLYLLMSAVMNSQTTIEKTHIIRIVKGDNLWNISKRIYGSGKQYSKIWNGRLDHNISNNPNLVYPNMIFSFGSRYRDTLQIAAIDSCYNIKDDIIKIRDATISIDSNIKSLPEKVNTPDYKDLYNYLYVIGTGFIIALLTFWFIPSDKKKIK